MKTRAIANVVFAVSTVVFLAAGLAAQAPAGERQGSGRPRGGGQNQAQDAAPAFKKLSRAEFDLLASDPSKIVVVDVRRPDEHQSIGQFPVFLSIQLADLERHLAYIPRDRAVITVSNHAARAGRALRVLEKNGLKVAGAIGVQDYESEGGVLLKIAPPAPRADAASAPPAGRPGADAAR